MTDNEIIKALECCFIKINCTDCPCDEGKTFAEDCLGNVGKLALSLINRQKAEIERLEKELEIRPPASASFVFKLEEMQERGKMLEAKWKADVRAEAIKEFAESLKKVSARRTRDIYGERIFFKDIDNLVKEMVGENNENL